MNNILEFEDMPVEINDLEERNSNHLLPSDKSVKLTPDDYRTGIEITNLSDIEKSPWSQKRKTIELTDSNNNDLNTQDEDVNFVVEVTPNLNDAFTIRNTYSEEPMIVWVYGEKKLVPPGESINISAIKPGNLKGIEGIKDGVFYVQVGKDAAVRVGKQPLHSEVTVKNCSLNINGEQQVAKPDEPVKEYSEEEYDKAKKAVMTELGRTRKRIEEDLSGWDAVLTNFDRIYGSSITQKSKKQKEDVQTYKKEGRAALSWLDNTTDDPEQRELVANHIKRSAEFYLQFVQMEANSQGLLGHQSFASFLENEEKERVKKLIQSAEVLRVYKGKK